MENTTDTVQSVGADFDKPSICLSGSTKQSSRTTTTCDSSSETGFNENGKLGVDSPSTGGANDEDDDDGDSVTQNEIFATAVDEPAGPGTGTAVSVGEAGTAPPSVVVDSWDDFDAHPTSSSAPGQLPLLNDGFGYSVLNNFDYGIDTNPYTNRVTRQRSLPRRDPSHLTTGRVSRYSTMPVFLNKPASPIAPSGAGSYIVPGPRGAADIVVEGEEELHEATTTTIVDVGDGTFSEKVEDAIANLPWWRRWFCGTPVPGVPPVVLVEGNQEDADEQLEEP